MLCAPSAFVILKPGSRCICASRIRLGYRMKFVPLKRPRRFILFSSRRWRFTPLSRMAFFRHGERGVAAVECALWAPLMTTLFLGAVEMTRSILAVENAAEAAFTVADRVSEGHTVTTTDLNPIVTAGGHVLQPLTFRSNGFVFTTSVAQTGTLSTSNPPIVQWPYTKSGRVLDEGQQGRVGWAGRDAAEWYYAQSQ
jgi:Flp pilus assembly protein TadG